MVDKELNTTDGRIDMPMGAAVNYLIMSSLKNTESFKKACEDIPKHLGFIPPVGEKEWPFFNMALGVGLLYCSIVVNKELFNLDKHDKYF